MEKAIGFIPARYASTRLPAKPLALIDGIPMVIRVWQNVSKSKLLSKAVIATDDERIAQVCRDFNADYVITDPELPSGTDRIFQAYCRLGEQADIVLNIQGDEPLINADDIDKLICKFCCSKFDVGTLIKKIDKIDDLDDPSIVKVVLGDDNTAIYFSRSVIPFFRDENKSVWLAKRDYWKHIGIYAYKSGALKMFVSLAQSDLELTEKLEQLRLLEKGFKFLCVETPNEFISIDTPEDLERIEKFIQSQK